MIQNIAFRRLREEFHGGFIRDFRHIPVGSLDPVHKYLSVAFNGQLIAKLRSLRKVRLNGSAGTRHGEGERIGSGIIQCHTVDLPAGENKTLGRHCRNGLLAGAELRHLTIRVSSLAALHAAVFRVNGCKAGILEDDLARLQYSALAIHDVETVLCPIPALTEGVACLVICARTLTILGQAAEIEPCAGGEHHVVMNCIGTRRVAKTGRSFPYLKTPSARHYLRGVRRQGDRGDQRNSRVIIPTGNRCGSNDAAHSRILRYAEQRSEIFTIASCGRQRGIVTFILKTDDLPLEYRHHPQVFCPLYRQGRLSGLCLGQRIIRFRVCFGSAATVFIHDPLRERFVSVFFRRGYQLHRVTIFQSCKCAAARHISVAGRIGLQRYLDRFYKVRLNGSAGARHGEGKRVGSGIIQCHTVDLPASENIARGRHGRNFLLTSAEIHHLDIRVSIFAVLHTAVLRLNGRQAGILEDDLARLQYSALAIHDVETVLCPIPALTEGVACLVICARTLTILGQAAEIEPCAGGEHHVVMNCIGTRRVAKTGRSFPYLKTPSARHYLRGVRRQGDRGDQRNSRVIIPTGNRCGSNDAAHSRILRYAEQRSEIFTIASCGRQRGIVTFILKTDDLPLEYRHHPQVFCPFYRQGRLSGLCLGQRIIRFRDCFCSAATVCIHDPLRKRFMAVFLRCGSQLHRVTILQACKGAGTRHLSVVGGIGLQRYLDR